MDEHEQNGAPPPALSMSDEQLEALIALVEARVVENLTHAIEQMLLERTGI